MTPPPDNPVAALREEHVPSGNAARPPPTAILVLTVGLLAHVATAIFAIQGVIQDTRHPTDMPFGMFFGVLFLVCIAASLIAALAVFWWMRVIGWSLGAAALVAGGGMLAAMPCAWL